VTCKPAISWHQITQLSLILFLTLLSFNSLAQHFQVITTNNPYMPMNIIVNSASLDGLLLQSGDEIAVFDVNGSEQEICVGMVTVISEFTSDTNYIIVATADDPTTEVQDGFITGNEIIFRYWDSSETIEIILISDSFSSSYNDDYQPQGTALVELDGYSYQTWTGAVSTDWNNVANWNFGCLPSLLFDVLIPANPIGNYFPTITGLDAKCENLTIEENAIITITGKLTLGYTGPPYN